MAYPTGQNPQEDERTKGGQYATVPGFALPGHSSPSNTKDAPGSTIVYSYKGAVWEEVTDDYQKIVSDLTGKTIESALSRMHGQFGEIFYITGGEDTKPFFKGSAIGDTCRVQRPGDKVIVAEWKWNGNDWEKVQVSSAVVSNLDVGKLTAGAATINELAARKIAAATGQFLELKTEQLVVSGEANFKKAVAQEIWAKIVHSHDAEFVKIKAGMLDANAVTAENIRAGAIDGQVITGARFQTSKDQFTFLAMTPDGLLAKQEGRVTFRMNPRSGDVYLRGNVGNEDTWSYSYFGDIKFNGSEFDSNKDKWGCGVLMASKQRNYLNSGIIAIRETKATGYLPEIMIQAPRINGTYAPRLTLSTNGLYADAGLNYGQVFLNLTPRTFAVKFNDAHIHLLDRFFEVRLGKADDRLVFQRFTHINGQPVADGGTFGVYVNRMRRLGIEATYAHLTTGNRNNGFHVQQENIGMFWDNHHYVYVDGNGVHLRPFDKKFRSPVPGFTEPGGRMEGKLLNHICTESPWCGIEYWAQVLLDADGKGRYTLPEYVPALATDMAPWAAIASAWNPVRSRLVRDKYDISSAPWYVELEGTPGDVVSVLVKGSRATYNVDLRKDHLGESYEAPADELWSTANNIDLLGSPWAGQIDQLEIVDGKYNISDEDYERIMNGWKQ